MAKVNPTLPESPQDTAHEGILRAFASFFSVAAFYPVDHSKCTDALANLRQSLGQVVNANDFLSIEPYGDGIRLQGIVLDEMSYSSKTIHTLLDNLGLARLQFHSAAPLSELHQMAVTLNSLQLESDSSQEFHSLDFSELPTSVRIELRKFDWGPSGSEAKAEQEATSSSPLEKLMTHLGHMNWSNVQKQEFQLNMKSLLARISELTKNASQLDQDLLGTRQPGYDEVLAVGTSALGKALVLLSADDAPKAVDQLFKHAAEALAYTADSTAVSMMFEAFNDISEMQRKEKKNTADPEWGKDASHYSESVSSLSTKVLQMTARSTSPVVDPEVLPPEMWAICIQFVIKGVSESSTRQLQAKIEDYLSPPLEAAKQKVVEELITALIQNGDRKPIDAVLPLILSSMLRSNSEQFAHFLKELFPESQPEKLALIWPHLVGLMLRPKPPQNQTILKFLSRSIGSLPESRLSGETHRLDFLPVIQKGEMGTALFNLPHRNTRVATMALLKGRQSGLVGQHIYSRWKTKPVSNLAALLIRILGPFENSHKNIYLGLLGDDGVSPLAPEYKTETELLVLSALRSLESGNRKASWAKIAIQELGRIGGPESQAALSEIMNQRTVFLTKAWPDDCRKTAEESLQKLSMQPDHSRPLIPEGEE